MTKRQQSEPNAQPASEAARAAVEWEYRKRPIVVKASQWWRNGDHPHDDQDMFDYPDENGNVFQRPNGEGKVVRYFRRPDVPGEQTCKHCTRPMHDHGWIDTLEGGHIVCPGDYVITGVKGERYPCKPDIFTATYEPVASPQPPASEPSGRELPSLPCPDSWQPILRAMQMVHPDFRERDKLVAKFWRDLRDEVARHPAAPAGEREEVERLRGCEILLGTLRPKLADCEQALAKAYQREAALEASHAALQSKLDAVAGLVEKWRATSEASERRACIGHFPEGYSAESRAYENCADELAASLAE
jgi:hypothetical protein